MNDFSVWLLDELDRRGWRPTDLAREAGITDGTVSNILNGHKSPGWDACLSISKALHVPYDEVFSRAGLVSGKGEKLPEMTALDAERVIAALRKMTAEQRENVIRYILERARGQSSE